MQRYLVAQSLVMRSLTPLTPKTISIAPMMGWTNPSMQKLIKTIAPNMIFYSQMYHVEAVLRKPEKLTYSAENFVLQIGGSCPEKFFRAGHILKSLGINKININVGCPSPKVQKGNFGACLMREPQLVADCLNALVVNYSVDQLSVKCRLGVDHDDSEQFLHQFLDTIHESTSIKNFIVHARKAWLSGLNPKQNRDIPPLNYDRVYTLKKKYPEFHIGINGGITGINSIINHLELCDEVMIGRLVLNDLYEIHRIDALINECTLYSRKELLGQLTHYDKDTGRFLQSLYKGLPGCKGWRRKLPEIKDLRQLLTISG